MKIYSLELLAVAEEELNDAFEWYEQKRSGLGYEFIKEVSHYLSRIEKNPLQFPPRYGKEFHFASLNRFSYLIIYWIEKERNLIIISSIFHTSRKPKNNK